ncbi:BTB/POZ and MATH domain-containing protein 2 [Brachypodium distachyon]|nr:BTB/POZ and MATH domain-containing protein 2 [Brachypodium distachyon]|eukprot:XP_024311813.1 BTB/POZ and MATH domain-containing protein 2 [Brachypodium distachyon]
MSSYSGSVRGDGRPARQSASAIIADAVAEPGLVDGDKAAQNESAAIVADSEPGSVHDCGDMLPQQAASTTITEAVSGPAIGQGHTSAIVVDSVPGPFHADADAGDEMPPAQHGASTITNATMLAGCDSDASAQHTASAIVAKTVSGSHVLKIKSYSHTKGLGLGGILSDTFRVGGHCCRIVYYPDGCRSDCADWVSIGLLFVETHASHINARIKFSLLDHGGKPVPLYTTETHTVTTLSTRQEPLVSARFIERKTLESSYLKGDCFTVRCDVTITSGIRTEDTTKQSVVVPLSDIHQHLGQLLLTGKGTDVTFEVGRETFAAHRCVLAARSPVFMAELFGPMKENTATSIRIDDLEPSVFQAFLYFVYNDSLPDIDKGEEILMAQHLLVAADRYDLKRLKLICEDILCNSIDTETAAATLALAEQHGCCGLKDECFKFLTTPGKNLKLVMTSDNFQHLWSVSPSVLKELLAKLDAINGLQVI